MFISPVKNSGKINSSPLVPQIYFTELGQYWLRKWHVAYTVPSHYLNQCWVIVNWTLRNKLQWNFNQNTKLFIHKNAFQNIVCQMAAILSKGRWVKTENILSNILYHDKWSLTRTAANNCHINNWLAVWLTHWPLGNLNVILKNVIFNLALLIGIFKSYDNVKINT